MNRDTEAKTNPAKPRFLDDKAFQCLRGGELAEFHRLIASREKVDFSDTDLRGVDFRDADLAKVQLRGCYLRDADLRGQDLRHMDLTGCSIHNAKIGGTFFPDSLAPEEILLSLQFGTRMRSRSLSR